MIDLIVIIGIALVALAPLLLYRKTDNTKWKPQFKAVAEKRLTRYEDDNKEIVERLVRRFGALCVQIAACNSYWDSKRGNLLASQATQITMALKKRRFKDSNQFLSLWK